MNKKERKKKMLKYGKILIIVGLSIMAISLTYNYITDIYESEPNGHSTDIPEITTKDLQNQNVTGFTMVDMRQVEQYNKSHIGGAINIPGGCPSCYISDFKQNFTFNDTIVIYGNNSWYCARHLYNAGFKKLYILTDYDLWLPPNQ